MAPRSDWKPPSGLPDLRGVGTMALDLETRDDGLGAGRGSGWVHRSGHICGLGAAWHGGCFYAPVRHPDTECLDPESVAQWLRDHIMAGVRFVTQSGGYDWGWLRAEWGIAMPPPDQLEDTQALAFMVDENRQTYALDALCKWQGIQGKDQALLTEACVAFGFNQAEARSNIWRLPARYVGPYGEGDPVATLELFDRLLPITEQEGTHAAYRLEIDLLPMVQEMRWRGIRVDLDAAQHGYDRLMQRRDETFAEIGSRLGERVGMDEIGRTRWLERVFDAQGIFYPRTAKTNQGSFTAGTSGWMHKHQHWLPRLIVAADKYNKAARDYLKTDIMDYAHNGRIHPEIYPHRRSDKKGSALGAEGGARTTRFAYANPPLQQMPSRDKEITPLIRGCFLPEPGEFWCKPDISQQEFRLNVHYSHLLGLRGSDEAVQAYRNDPNTDFHKLVVDWTGLSRDQAKAINFAKSYGAGVKKFAAMADVPLEEAEELYRKHSEAFPFLDGLAEACERTAQRRGWIRLLDGARSHFDRWEAARWEDNRNERGGWIAPKPLAEAKLQWPNQRLRRADCRKAGNRLIQGGASRQTKLAMRAMWREGIVPLLQMHDEIDRSVSSPEQGERSAQIMREAVELAVPVVVEVKYGRNWADAKHDWQALHSD